MKKSTFIIFTAVILGSWLIFSAASSQEDLAELRKPYWIGSNEFPAPPNAIELKSIKVFPPESEAADAVLIGGAQCFAQDKLGRFFIPDWRNDEILIFDKEGRFQFRFGDSGQGPGDFMKPRDIFSWDEQVIIRDVSSLRFQFFDMKGRYLHGFKAFKSYYSFVVHDKSIYAAPAVYQPQRPNSGPDLVEILDFDGRVLKSFGAHLEVPKTEYISLNQSCLALTNEASLIIAFNFFPIIRKYSTEGVLLTEIRFKSGISEKFEPLNKKMMARASRGGQVPYGFIINAVYADEDGLYVATAAPRRFEILLLGPEGKASEYYYKNLEAPIGCSSLLVRKRGVQKEFYILKLYPANSVEVMVRK